MAYNVNQYTPFGPWMLKPNSERVSVISQTGNLRVQQSYFQGEPFVSYLGIPLNPSGSIVAPAAVNTRTCIINFPVVAPQVGDYLLIKFVQNFFQSKITAVTALGGDNYQIDTAQLFDYLFPPGEIPGFGSAYVELQDIHLNKDGSTTPVVANATPRYLYPGVILDIHSFVCVFETATDPSYPDNIGDIPALTYGSIVRYTNGITKNVGIYRQNGDLRITGFDVCIQGTKQDNFCMVGDFNLVEKYGSSIRMVSGGEDSDRFEFIVQDDVTGLIDLTIAARGHVIIPDDIYYQFYG